MQTELIQETEHVSAAPRMKHIVNVYEYLYGPRPVRAYCGYLLPIDDESADMGSVELNDCVVCQEILGTL